MHILHSFGQSWAVTLSLQASGLHITSSGIVQGGSVGGGMQFGDGGGVGAAVVLRGQSPHRRGHTFLLYVEKQWDSSQST